MYGSRMSKSRITSSVPSLPTAAPTFRWRPTRGGKAAPRLGAPIAPLTLPVPSETFNKRPAGPPSDLQSHRVLGAFEHNAHFIDAGGQQAAQRGGGYSTYLVQALHFADYFRRIYAVEYDAAVLGDTAQHIMILFHLLYLLCILLDSREDPARAVGAQGQALAVGPLAISEAVLFQQGGHGVQRA